MSASTVWSRRNVLAIVAILVIAAVVIAVAAFVTSARSSEQATPEQEPHPDFEAALIDESDVSSLLDGRELMPTVNFNGLYPPLEDPGDPIECNSIGSFADATDYIDAPWRYARTEVFENDGGDPLWIGEAVVLFGSPEDSRGFFDTMKSVWDSCDGQTFRFGNGSDWEMQDYTASDDLLLTTTAVENTDYPCERALGLRDVYIAEAQVCGPGTGTGKAEQMVDEILSAAEV